MTHRHRGFEFFLRAARPVLAREHAASFAGEVIDAARVEYEHVLPQLPDIGGMRNVFQPVMTVNGWIVALHRAMRARGKNAEDSVRVSHEVIDGWLRGLPRIVLRTIGWLALTAPVRWFFERQAHRSQLRRHAEDFVWRVERGPEGELSLIFDECAVNKWYDAQDVRELKPYCNFVDVTYSKLMGMGIDATETIGLGCEQCALRFEHGRETVVPRNLEPVIAKG